MLSLMLRHTYNSYSFNVKCTQCFMASLLVKKIGFSSYLSITDSGNTEIQSKFRK